MKDGEAPSSEELKSSPSLGSLFQLPRSVLILGGWSLALMVLVYFIYPAFPTTSGKTLAGWTWQGCNDANGFLHGRFIPVAFLVMVWMGFQRAKDEELKPSYWGLVSLLFGMLFSLPQCGRFSREWQ